MLMYQRIRKDSQGTPLKVGQKVAYNLSGQVWPGTITRINPNSVSIALVNNPSRASYYKAGHVSTVRNDSSILVLADPE